MSDRPSGSQRARSANVVARTQALWFLVTGLWPLAHRRSFEYLTGPKVDFWLVRTVGLLLAAIGAALWRAADREDVGDAMRLLGASSATALAGIDVYHVAKRTIRPIYLVDAAAEAGVVVGWLSGRPG